MTKTSLLKLAAEAAKSAYSPYSGVAVGAAVEMQGGAVFTGCNIENASFGLTLCAERVALSAAIVAGHQKLKRVAVTLHRDGGDSLMQVPCGACLQFMAEFAGDDVEIVTGDGAARALADFLPLPFRLER